MKLLFLPALAIMNRLSYRAKFGLLGILISLAFASLLFALANQLNRTIERSQTELIATSIARPLLKSVELMQQHRGMSATLLSGLNAIAQKRAEKEKEVDAALERLGSALPEVDRSRPEWEDLTRQWATVKRDGLGWSQPDRSRRIPASWRGCWPSRSRSPTSTG